MRAGSDLFRLRDPARAAGLSRVLRRLAPERPVKIVHVCGTHEAAIAEHGLRSLLPDGVDVYEGPGCPVCVTSTADINLAVALALEKGAILCTFGDMLRVPGTELTLEEARAHGADVRVVLSAADAVRIARENPRREVVFFAVGFETTAPGTAAVLLDGPPDNFSVLCSHKLIPPALEALLRENTEVDGFLAPGHVSTIIGADAYRELAGKFHVPVVVGGFEPLDVLFAIALILRQLGEGRAEVENAYPRAVRPEGNVRAKRIMAEAFRVVDAVWRGIGTIPASGLELGEGFTRYNAREKFELEARTGDEEPPGCRCPEIIMAKAVPTDCPLFGTACTPLSPVGPCMVGVEGACSIWYRYGERPVL
ncbi:MAG: hydrogenase formation protein HypD [Caldiserica bacterium]|nr:hydrogenase formation protein HypD [Caldisericota bacterium]